MKTLKLCSLLLAVVVAGPAAADSWDTLGSKHSRNVVRYGHVDDFPGRGLARGQAQQHGNVNIIVAPRAPINAWAPRWDDRYSRRYDRRHDQFVFNSSLGFIAGSTIGLLAAPRMVEQNYYVREYAEPQVVIRHEGNGRSISLFKDRYGTCYERETDRYGRVIKRRIADYNCDF
jgi:hypothetical protein